MASPHRIQNFNFEFWRGVPPRLVQSRIQTFSRPGVFGSAFVNVGKWEPQFTVVLVAVFGTFADAAAAVGLYKALVGSDPQPLMYNHIDYSANPFQHLYSVDQVDEVSLQAIPRTIGPDFDYGPGAEVTTRWTLTPIAIGSITS